MPPARPPAAAGGRGLGIIALPPLEDFRCQLCPDLDLYDSLDDLIEHVDLVHYSGIKQRGCDALQLLFYRVKDKRARKERRAKNAPPVLLRCNLDHYEALLETVEKDEAPAGGLQQRAAGRALRPRGKDGRVVPAGHAAAVNSQEAQQEQTAHEEEDRNKKKCSVCGKTFAHLGNLKRHIQFSHRHTSRCSQCGIRLLSSQMEEHVNEYHARQVVFRCRGCENVFATEAELLRHYTKAHSAPSTFTQVDTGKNIASYHKEFEQKAVFTLEHLYAVERKNISAIISGELAKRKVVKTNCVVQIRMIRVIEKADKTITDSGEFILNSGYHLVRRATDIPRVLTNFERQQGVILEDLGVYFEIF